LPLNWSGLHPIVAVTVRLHVTALGLFLNSSLISISSKYLRSCPVCDNAPNSSMKYFYWMRLR
jgi:formate dehydrogenase maturation protein FdhE